MRWIGWLAGTAMAVLLNSLFDLGGFFGSFLLGLSLSAFGYILGAAAER